MSLLTAVERCLINLEEDVNPEYIFIFMNKETALSVLKETTGQDFGLNAKLWRQWLEEHRLVPKKVD
jgi:hypothetical protein